MKVIFLLLLPVTLMAQETAPSTLVINEVQVANIDQYLDKANCYGSWIELYNPTDTVVPLRNMLLTDGENIFRLLSAHGSVPVKGFKTIWFGHHYSEGNYGSQARLQVPYKLEYEGGTISLLASDSSLVSTVAYPPATPRCSWARTQDGGDTWETTSEPTPDATNATSSFATFRLEAPLVDTDSRIFTDDFTVRVSIPMGVTLRYTTDGSAPTATNGETSSNGSFDISSTTILRLCLIQDGYLSSPVVTRSYIYRNHDYYLPVLSVVSEPRNFFDNKVGVFVRGTNGISGNGQNSACNWNMDWERPINMEFLVPKKDENGNTIYSSELNIEADLEICGGWTRAYGGATVDGRYWEARSSFRIKTDKRYEGVNSIDYPVFPAKPYNKYRCWQVRNGGNDTYSRTKDPVIQMMVQKSGFYVDCQDYQPAHVFLNGEYYGMLNIRESNNKHFAYSNYGIDFDDMDQFDLSNAQYNQKIGDIKAWSQLQTLAKSLAQTKSEETYSEVCNLLDIDEYINYMALECYMGPSDWITNTNNVKGFRSRSDGKFHFVLFDVESAFEKSDMLTSVLNTNGGANVDDLFRNLMKYDPFRRQFMDAFCIVDGSVFEPTRCEEIVRGIYKNINPALAFEGSSGSLSMINTIRSAYNGTRITNLKNYYDAKYSLYATLSSNIPEARLAVNGQEIPTGRFAGYLFSYNNLPIRLSAKAPAGYVFSGWKSEELTASTTTLIPFGSEWMYFDRGSMDGYDWKSLSFADRQNGWSIGTAPFGFANDGYFMQENSVTKLDAGSGGQKRPTYYFRHTFHLDFPLDEADILTFNYQVDDGVMLYVNGNEVGGYYIASGSSYSDYTIDQHYEGQEPYMGSFVIPHEFLVAGENQIALEVKNCHGNSSDIWFDGSLLLTGKGGEIIASEDDLDLYERFASNSNVVLKAVFTPIADEQQRWEAGASPLRINEVSAGNDIYINDYRKKSDWVELYNTTDHDISLEGLYLSDSRKNPQKCLLQKGVVPAHGTCIIWCDGREAISQLHVPFKLDNADGACVSIQAADGSWADRLEYLEQGKWQTYGRYPDGGNMATILNQPTIAQSNKLGMTDYDATTLEEWQGTDRTITLDLAEGWNWVSHNMKDDVDKSRFLMNALCLQGQEESLLFCDDVGWQGSLQALKAARGYKIKMQNAASVTLRGPIYDTNTPVTLHAGWNWIGCPLYNATTLDAALGNYAPQDGDKIVGLDTFATYEDGQWHGSLTSLQPGQSYLFYTARQQEFCWQNVSPQRSSSRRYASAGQAEDGAWHTDIHAYPDVMTMVASVEADEQISLEEPYYVGAFCGDECRGVGVLDGDMLFMNIHGGEAEPDDGQPSSSAWEDKEEKIVFRLLDSEGSVYGSIAYVVFQSYKQLGTVQNPHPLWFASQEVLDEIKPVTLASDKVQTILYYDLSGRLISTDALLRESGRGVGLCIRKVIYEDGSVKVSKLYR